jgi:hypothetical protein
MHYLKKGKVTRLLVLISVFMLPTPLVKGQAIESRLAQKVKAFDSESSSTIVQLTDLARRFQIPMGIEWRDELEVRVAPPIHARNTTVQQILRRIVQEQPRNDFTLNDGVIHVFASSLINDPRNFLNLRIPHFRVENETLFGAAYRLRTSIHRILQPSPTSAGGHGHGIPSQDNFDVPNVSFSGSNLTVRQILNNIVAMQGNALWIVRIKPSQMMAEWSFYAQTVSAINREAAPDFKWEFVPLKEGN